MLSFDERWNAFTSYEETQAQFSMEVERGIQNFLQVERIALPIKIVVK